MRHRNYLPTSCALAGAGLLALASAHASASPIVTIGPAPGSNFTVAVGQTLTIPIYAIVTDSTTPTPPGIFTYDLDALVSDSSGLEVISYTLDGNTSLGNPSFITIDSLGARNLNAGFDPPNVGIGTQAELFTVTVQGILPGTDGLNISDDITPQGPPILLGDGSTPPVNTSQILVQVTPVPEPASLALLALGIPLMLRRRR